MSVMPVSTNDCLRCGSEVAVATPFCPSCGWPQNGGDRPLRRAPAPIGLPAPLPRRAAASLADGVLTTACVALGAVAGVRLSPMLGLPGYIVGAAVAVAVLVVLDIVMAVLRAGRGSPGLRATALVLRRTDGSRPTPASAWARTVLFRLIVPTVVGGISPVLDRSGARRGWHDRATGVIVAIEEGRS